MNLESLILGPCAAESREQVLRIAGALVNSLTSRGDRFLFRAGLWKPRTSPSTFQGVGARGLPWLQEVAATYHIPASTEVATGEQVRLCLEAGITHLWIGARTSANPIAVQAIADALAVGSTAVAPGRSPVVYIKNPVNDDVPLWLGNIARLEKAATVVAIHRGCNHHPRWHMAYALRQARPDIPLFLDPSHMSGDAAKVPALIAKARTLAYDGLMVEVHDDPAHALSDAKQQITPTVLANSLTRVAPFNGAALQTRSDLPWFRAQIDELDEQLWDIIAQRMEVSRAIGDYKHEKGITPLQPERYNELLTQRLQWAKDHNLPPQAVQAIFDDIHALSLAIQCS